MKKLVIILLALFVVACNNDDDSVVDTCDKATNTQANNITTTSATLTWSDSNAAGSYIIEYGVSGFALGSGTTLTETTTPVEIENLLPQTTYDVYIQVVCSADNLSMYSDVFSFTTATLPCNTVTNIDFTLITDTNASISWEDMNAIGSYEVEYGLSGFSLGSGTTIPVENTNIELTGLSSSTSYDIYIRTICATDNISSNTDVLSFTTLAIPVVPDFLPTLSELNLFIGDLSNLEITPYGFEYELSTKLFTDYALKQRFVVLPNGEKMTYTGNGLPLFPDNTVIAKTFYYNNDETDLSQGKKIIETRLLIKMNGSWELGNYKWNDAQTEAILDTDGAVVPVTWTNTNGESQSINYEIPSNTDCFTCHNNNSQVIPIGPKLRTLNFDVNGSNQLQALIDNNMLEGLTDPSTVNVLPNWEDESLGLERRARAYMDVNCAHCHSEGGNCAEQSNLRLTYETAFEESGISNSSSSILTRIQNTIPEYGMPLIGTTIIHDEGVAVLIDYINSLE